MTHRTSSPRRTLLRAPLALLGAAPALRAQPAPFPSKPIRIVVGFPPGNTLDTVSRVVAEALRAKLGQPVIVENKPGANGTIAAGDVLRSPPDGHTLLATNSSGMTVNPQLYKKLGYQLADFAPVSMIVSAPLILMTNPASERTRSVRTVSDLMALARQKPGEMRFGSAGPGNITQLSFETLTNRAGVKFTTVAYKGTSASQQGLLGQEVDCALDVPAAIQLVKAGRLTPIAVTGPSRWRDLPEVPTIAEAGFPGFEVTFWLALVASAQTPPAVVRTLHAAIASLRDDPTVMGQLAPHGVIELSDPATFGNRMRTEHDMWAEVIKRENISLD
jgi:tripartite-type tricarboxylate transporter receptor subunit TctC